MEEYSEVLRAEGAAIVGECASIEAAWRFVRSALHVDLAILDINLRGEVVYPIADALLTRGVRIAFVTGYGRSILPARFAGIPCLEKPLSYLDISAVLVPSG